MMIVIQGGSGSGKSAYAEETALRLDKRTSAKGVPSLYYIATMKVYDEEGKRKVERHKKLRQGKGFFTVEQPDKLGQAAAKIEKNSTVLLECMSNLVANEMFGAESEETADCKSTVAAVIYGVKQLKETAENLIIVTNNVFEDGIQYDEATRNYQEALGSVNRELAKMAEQVTEVAAGIPVPLKCV